MVPAPSASANPVGVDPRFGGEADGAIGGTGGQGRGGALGQHPAVVDDDNLIRQPLGLVQFVGGEDHADAPVALGGDDVAHRDAALGIDAGGGLVEEEHVGLPDQSESQGEALLLTTGQPPPRGAADRTEPDPFDQLVGILGIVVVPGEEMEDLGRAEHRVDAAALEHHADPGNQLGVVPAGVEPEDPDRPAVRLAVALEDLDGAGLAGTVRTEQRHHLAGLSRKGQPVDGDGVAVADDHLVA